VQFVVLHHVPHDRRYRCAGRARARRGRPGSLPASCWP